MKNNSYVKLREIIEKFGKIEKAEWELVEKNFKPNLYKKGDYLLKPAMNSDKIFFILEGLIKRYVICHDGRQFITSLDAEKRLVSDFAAMIEHKETSLYIEAIEDTYVLESSINISQILHESSDVWNDIGRKIAENRYLEKSKREYDLLTNSTYDLYVSFKKENHELFKRLAQKDIARYLGVTPESLSRVLRKQK